MTTVKHTAPHHSERSDRVPRRKPRVEVIVSNDEKRMNDEALAALAKDPEVYRRGELLVNVVRSEGPKRAVIRSARLPSIVQISDATLREMLADRIDFRKWTSGSNPDLRQVNPPPQCYRALLRRGSWPEIRPLEGITECPLLRPDGSILQEPGYDEMTGLLYRPNSRFLEVPRRPSAEQVRTALRKLETVVVDFPFRGPADRSAWFASLLTPLSRHAFSGPSPCNVIDSNTRGCGKGLLVSTTSFISAGRDIARMPHCQNVEEQRKAILGVAIEAIPMVLIDNVAGPFGSAVFDAAFTATEWRDRLLGRSKMVTAPLTTVWFITGNNVTVVGDTSRRCLHIRLESPLEHPEERSDFQQPDLLKWVKVKRHELTSAALILLRAYFVAKRPDQGLPAWGSFEGWSDLVRNCLVWLDLPDPGETRIELRSSAGGEEGLVRNFVEGLEEVFQQLPGQCGTARDIVEKVQRATSAYASFREALSELILRPDGGSLPSAAQVGVLLKKYRGRIVGGKAINHAQEQKTNRGVLWCVRSVGHPGASDAGDASDADLSLARIGAGGLEGAGEAKPTERESPSLASPASPTSELERWQIR